MYVDDQQWWQGGFSRDGSDTLWSLQVKRIYIQTTSPLWDWQSIFCQVYPAGPERKVVFNTS